MILSFDFMNVFVLVNCHENIDILSQITLHVLENVKGAPSHLLVGISANGLYSVSIHTMNN